MRFSDFPFLRYLPFLIAGIFIEKQVLLSPVYLWISVGFLWSAYLGILLFINKKTWVMKTSFLAYMILVLFGAAIESNRIQTQNKSDWEGAQGYIAEVLQYDMEKPNSSENRVLVKAILRNGLWENTDEQLLIYHQNIDQLEPGQVIWVNSAPDTIPSPTFPEEFNYSEYLARKGIFRRQFIGQDFLLIGENPNSSYLYALDHFRQRLSLMLEEQIPDEEARQVANALLLGQKQNLDKDVRQAYSASGVMHILAVSGLHVGIIYLMLMFLVKPLKLKGRNQKMYFLFVVLLIWVYAALTGMSPSVMRASTMFSLIALGQLRDRKPSIFNVLAFSATLMITFNPSVIFEVGFQLSYLAVLGIVMLQPLILKCWNPPNKWLEYFWQIVAVSIAAQLATFPLTLFYFHAFPTYFLLGNLIIIPLAFLIMHLGIPLLAFGWVPVLGELLGVLVSKTILFQNFIVLRIQSLPYPQIDQISIEWYSMFLVWVLLLIWYCWPDMKKRKLAWIGLFSLFLWAGLRVYDQTQIPKKEMILARTESGVLIEISSFGDLMSWNKGVRPGDISFKIDPYRLKNGWNQIPKSLQAISVNDSLLSFPVHGFHLDTKGQKVRMLKGNPSKIEIWSSGKWSSLDITDEIPFQNTAVRILF
ncbi:ComEC/Rec2 family competence protein [Algoriphagus machipongonensis]|uniref:ComEC/Rec2 family protein n=1 Tax=Algoriphagus machipongonensis TaxID=388413 RepID=A3HYH5_9BACT|nr:ComEC/Rec2 family competence protein [Algoriphagus machipongonensis]EAZ80311.1 putative ComEC/Rec2 family protein [Algoriphagus machipongonensis]